MVEKMLGICRLQWLRAVSRTSAIASPARTAAAFASSTLALTTSADARAASVAVAASSFTGTTTTFAVSTADATILTPSTAGAPELSATSAATPQNAEDGPPARAAQPATCTGRRAVQNIDRFRRYRRRHGGDV